jgi:chromosome partitioning protein
VAPLISRGEDTEPQLIEINSRLALLPGDLQLSSTEDALSAEWTNCLSESLVRERAFLVTTSLARTAQRAGAQWQADLVLIDIGPNLGAINRSALLGADHVVVPVAADIFSLKGLINVGRGLADWRRGWKRRLESPPGSVRLWPSSAMEPLGYIVSRFSIYKGEKSAHFRRWINRVPDIFHREILGEPESPHLTVDEDSSCLAWLKDYRSLMPMAQEAHKPIFKLKPADGAIGGHQHGVGAAYADFEKLAQSIANRVPILVPS